MTFDFSKIEDSFLTPDQFAHVQNEILNWSDWELSNALGLKRNGTKTIERWKLGQKAFDHREVPGTIVSLLYLYCYHKNPIWAPKQSK